MKRFGLAMVAVMALALGVANADPQLTVATCTIDLAVKGMTCGAGCPPRVSKALSSVKGVTSVKVSYPDKTAKVIAGGSVCTTKGATALVKALKGAGFNGSVTKITLGVKRSAEARR